MLYKDVTKTVSVTDTWKKDQYFKETTRLKTSSLNLWSFDLNTNHGQVRVENVDWKPLVEKTRSYINSTIVDDIVEISADITFKYREYTGKRSGTVNLHKRIIPMDLINKDKKGELLHREYEFGWNFIKTFLPEGVQRIGCCCCCCYGSGPDLEATSTVVGDNLELVFTVDFDFEYEDEMC